MLIVLVSIRGRKTLKSRISAELFTWILSISVVLDYVIKLICTPTEEQTGNSRRGSPDRQQQEGKLKQSLAGLLPGTSQTPSAQQMLICRSPTEDRDVQWQGNPKEELPRNDHLVQAPPRAVSGETSAPACRCETQYLCCLCPCGYSRFLSVICVNSHVYMYICSVHVCFCAGASWEYFFSINTGRPGDVEQQQPYSSWAVRVNMVYLPLTNTISFCC